MSRDTGYPPRAIQLLAGEIASDVFQFVPEQTAEKLEAIREAVQRRLDCQQGRDYMRQITTGEFNRATRLGL
jgi:hypothetical protein